MRGTIAGPYDFLPLSNGQSGYTGEKSSFFDPKNKEAMELRTKFAMLALDGKNERGK